MGFRVDRASRVRFRFRVYRVSGLLAFAPGPPPPPPIATIRRML